MTLYLRCGTESSFHQSHKITRLKSHRQSKCEVTWWLLLLFTLATWWFSVTCMCIALSDTHMVSLTSPEKSPKCNVTRLKSHQQSKCEVTWWLLLWFTLATWWFSVTCLCILLSGNFTKSKFFHKHTPWRLAPTGGVNEKIFFLTNSSFSEKWVSRGTWRTPSYEGSLTSHEKITKVQCNKAKKSSTIKVRCDLVTFTLVYIGNLVIFGDLYVHHT